MSIAHKTEIGGTTGNYALDVYVKGGSGDPSTILGTVGSVTAAPTFTVASLTGYGDDYFDSWYAYVVWDKDGAAAAPQGESQAITGYTSSTGAFAHAAFTDPLVAGDKVLISLGDPNAAGDASAANQATIIADVTGINGDAMRGTENAALAASWTAALATILGNFSAARIGYIDELDAGNLPSDIDDIVAVTDIRRIASGSKTLGAGVTKYLSIDSGTNGAEIIGVVIKGVVGADWTLDVYVPTADAVAAPAAGDKRDTNAYVNTDAEGGMLSGLAIPYNCFLDFTNDSAGNDDVDDVVILYRSASTLTLAWEA